MNAVKSGSIAMGSPAGAAATVFPEMGALLVPYLVKDYVSAYAMLNGRIGDKISPPPPPPPHPPPPPPPPHPPPPPPPPTHPPTPPPPPPPAPPRPPPPTP